MLHRSPDPAPHTTDEAVVRRMREQAPRLELFAECGYFSRHFHEGGFDAFAPFGIGGGFVWFVFFLRGGAAGESGQGEGAGVGAGSWGEESVAVTLCERIGYIFEDVNRR